MDVHFVREESEAIRRFSDPTLNSAVICSENLVTTFHRKKKVLMNQSWAIGFSILEISKLIMMKRYYENIQKTYPGASCVLMSDTGEHNKKSNGKKKYFNYSLLIFLLVLQILSCYWSRRATSIASWKN